jgi:hypothetical protein
MPRSYASAYVQLVVLGSLLLIYIYNRVSKQHYIIGLVGLYNLCPMYDLYVAALDQGHQAFKQSDWPSRSRDGISLYSLLHHHY